MDDRQALFRLDAAQHGDEKAMTALIADFLPFIRRKASSAAAQSGLEAEDLAQEGLIGLVLAVRTFTPDGGASFRTWGSTCIVNGMRTAMRRARRVSAVPANAVVPIDDAGQLVSDDDPESRIIARDETQRLRVWMRSHLSAREQQVLALYLAGGSYAFIADRLSLRDGKAVDNALQRIRKKMRAYPSMP